MKEMPLMMCKWYLYTRTVGVLKSFKSKKGNILKLLINNRLL